MNDNEIWEEECGLISRSGNQVYGSMSVPIRDHSCHRRHRKIYEEDELFSGC